MIHDVSDIVASIAAAIEEQATVTKDIARNIGEATSGVRDANLRVAESSHATQDIAKEIAGVDAAARQMADGSEQVRSSATDLSKLAEQLQTTVNRFQVHQIKVAMSTRSVSENGQTVLLATFFVRDALCAMDAAGIQEVIRLGPLTPVRHAPQEVAGIVNLRGKIVTILDLGLRLGLGGTVPTGDSRIFIIEDRNEFVGLLVDRVDEVVEVERDQWQAPPANVLSGQARFFQGVYRTGGRVITVLDPASILAEGVQ